MTRFLGAALAPLGAHPLLARAQVADLRTALQERGLDTKARRRNALLAATVLLWRLDAAAASLTRPRGASRASSPRW
jgi:hypothetical protein